MQVSRVSSPGLPSRLDHRLVVAAVFLIAAVAIRAVQFGNPVVQIDEQFYLLAGDRLLHGALPYTDIWDRKPVGLFLIYALIRMLGGDGVVQYQLVAAGFAAATAFLIQRIARRAAPPLGGLLAGLLYLVYLMANGGDGGQAPVFYNFLTAAAALAVIRAIERPAFDRAAVVSGCVAMALIGAALQVKYTVLFEGVYFGLALMITAWRRGFRWTAAIPIVPVWVGLALLPTVLAIAVYAVLGHLPDFMFANFESIFLRPVSVGGDAVPRLTKIAVHVLPLAAAAVAGCATGNGRGAGVRLFITGWAIVAVAAMLGFGTYHDHYALPLLLPLAIAGTPIYGIRGFRLAATIVIALAGIGLAVQAIGNNRAQRGTGTEARAMSDYIRARPDRTLFVFSGDPVLYHLTGSALPTRWSFPTLLSERRDIGTMQVDQIPELARIMATRPRFVVARDYPFREASPAAWRLMLVTLERDYRVALARQIGKRRAILYERRADR